MTKTEPMKPGPQTSEFWITILCAIAGLYLIVFTDKTVEGMALMSIGGAGYAISRGIVKGAAVKTLGTVGLCLALTSCGVFSEYGGPDFKKSQPVMERVERWAGDYVREDVGLIEPERLVRLAELDSLADQQDAGVKWQGVETPRRPTR